MLNTINHQPSLLQSNLQSQNGSKLPVLSLDIWFQTFLHFHSSIKVVRAITQRGTPRWQRALCYLSLSFSRECIKSPDPHRPVADKPHLRKVQIFWSTVYLVQSSTFSFSSLFTIPSLICHPEIAWYSVILWPPSKSTLHCVLTFHPCKRPRRQC